MTSTSPETTVERRAKSQPDALWNTVVWDDPVNLMSYVTRVFVEHFGYSQQRAHNLMMEVHMLGKATVSSGAREHMEADVRAMHSYGLNATLEQAAE